MGLKFRPYVRAECPKKAQGEKQAGWWISETKYVRLGRAGNSPQIHPLLFRHHFAVCTLCFRRSSPRREFAAGRDGVRRRHAGVRPLDAGPPRALADHQPRLVTLSSAADYSSSFSPDSISWSPDQGVGIRVLRGLWLLRSIPLGLLWLFPFFSDFGRVLTCRIVGAGDS